MIWCIWEKTYNIEKNHLARDDFFVAPLFLRVITISGQKGSNPFFVDFFYFLIYYKIKMGGGLMEILQLVYFCSAAETENFAETARKFNVPPASISQSIKRLEKDVGVTLFDRNKNGVKLNEFGRIWYHSAKTSLGLFEDAKKMINNEELRGTIKLLVLSDRFMVSDAIGSFMQKHKAVSFTVDYYKKNKYDSYDLIITDNVDTSYDLSNYVYSNLLEDDIVIAVHKDSPLAQKDGIAVEELEGYPLITLSEESGLFIMTRRIYNLRTVTLEPVYRCDDPQSVIDYVDSGIGISVVPRLAWKKLYTENVCLKSIECSERVDALGKLKQKKCKLLRPKYRYMTRAVQVFVAELHETAEKYNEE